MQDMTMNLAMHTPLRSARLLAVRGITPDGTPVGDELLNVSPVSETTVFELDIPFSDDVEAYALVLTDTIGGVVGELVFVPEDDVEQFYTGADGSLLAFELELHGARIIHHGLDAVKDFVEVSTRS